MQDNNNLSINQSSDKVILNWQSFNIGKEAGVEFFMDSTQTKVRIRKLYVKDESKYGKNRKLLGIDLGLSPLKIYSDRVTLRYQQEAK